MNHALGTRYCLLAAAAVGLASLLSLTGPAGCHNGTASTAATANDDGSDETPNGSEAGGADLAEAKARTDGARLWEQNCMRCHNLRPPRERSDIEWDIFAHHMRIRANLTAEEHRLITIFLKSAN